MYKVNIFFLGLGTFLIGYLLTTAYVPVEDVYLQSLESIKLAILFLAAVISSWAYVLYKK